MKETIVTQMYLYEKIYEMVEAGLLYEHILADIIDSCVEEDIDVSVFTLTDLINKAFKEFDFN